MADAEAGVIVTIRISTRWWLRWYLDGLTIMAYLTGAEPDWTKVERMVRRAVVVRLEPAVFGVEA